MNQHQFCVPFSILSSVPGLPVMSGMPGMTFPQSGISDNSIYVKYFIDKDPSNPTGEYREVASLQIANTKTKIKDLKKINGSIIQKNQLSKDSTTKQDSLLADNDIVADKVSQSGSSNSLPVYDVYIIPKDSDKTDSPNKIDTGIVNDIEDKTDDLYLVGDLENLDKIPPLDEEVVPLDDDNFTQPNINLNVNYTSDKSNVSTPDDVEIDNNNIINNMPESEPDNIRDIEPPNTISNVTSDTTVGGGKYKKKGFKGKKKSGKKPGKKPDKKSLKSKKVLHSMKKKKSKKKTKKIKRKVDLSQYKFKMSSSTEPLRKKRYKKKRSKKRSKRR